MSNNELNQLANLKNARKFSDSEWIKRGLNPSSQNIVDLMETNIDNCLSDLIASIQESKTKNSKKAILKSNLRKNGKNFDTEEKEFIADYYLKISKIIDVDFSKELNNWLYGSIFSMIKSLSEIIKGKEKIIETIENICTKCESNLETFVLEKMDSAIENDYNIVKCNKCSEYNLIDNGSGNKQIQFGNYELVEQLSKNTYNFEDANIRLKQIKTFRK